MTQLAEHAKALIAADRLHAEYSLTGYVEYCDDIRNTILALDRSYRDSELVAFFEKKFVEEMEVIRSIAQYHPFEEPDKLRVQYVQSDPPDGLITLASGDVISLECTSSRDSRLEKFVLKQMREHNRIISFSGFEGSHVSGSERRGYTLRGMDITKEKNQEYLVEVDDESEVIERERRHITNKIDKKLLKNWKPGRNWLCIFVNEYVAIRDYRLVAPTLAEICNEYRVRLKQKSIEAVYFVGGREEPFMSFHPV